jgi:hypothetical protein
MSGGLLLHRIRGGKPGRTASVTAHALAVRARPWIPRPPAPAAFASAHLPEHSFSQAPGPGPRSAKIIRNGGYFARSGLRVLRRAITSSAAQAAPAIGCVPGAWGVAALAGQLTVRRDSRRWLDLPTRDLSTSPTAPFPAALSSAPWPIM